MRESREEFRGNALNSSGIREFWQELVLFPTQFQFPFAVFRSGWNFAADVSTEKRFNDN